MVRKILLGILLATSLLASPAQRVPGPGGVIGFDPCSISGTVKDCFTNVQDPISGNWTVGTASSYSSVQSTGAGAAASPITAYGFAIYTAGSFASTQDSTFVLNGTGSLGITGICIRCDTSGNGYLWIIALGTIYRIDAGAGTALSMSGACDGHTGGQEGNHLKFSASGTTLTCLDIETGISQTATDSTYSTGRPGFLMDNSASSALRILQWAAN